MANRKSNPGFAFVWMVLLGLVLHDAEAALKTMFLEDICYNQRSVQINLQYEPTGVLISLPQTESWQDFDCEVVLSPPRHSSVIVSIYRYDIGENDTLTIEDSDRFKIALTGFGNFKDEKKSFISEGRTVIRYKRGKEAHRKQGFQFTFTAAKRGSACFDNEFQCSNRLCILKEYACDGHNHCGDGSNQKTCVPRNEDVSNANRDDDFTRRTSKVSVIWISIIGAAGVVVFIIVTIFIVMVVRRSNSRKPKSSPAPTDTNQNSGGNVPLQSVSSTVPQQQPHAPTTLPSAPPVPEHEGYSFYNRVRRSIRGLKNPKTEDVSKEIVNSEVYQVPSMYPNLDHPEPATSEGGIVNPEFKSEES